MPAVGYHQVDALFAGVEVCDYIGLEHLPRFHVPFWLSHILSKLGQKYNK